MFLHLATICLTNWHAHSLYVSHGITCWQSSQSKSKNLVDSSKKSSYLLEI